MVVRPFIFVKINIRERIYMGCLYSIDVDPLTEKEWETLSRQFKSPEPPRPKINIRSRINSRTNKKNIFDPIRVPTVKYDL
jgi:hypothetical protein